MTTTPEGRTATLSELVAEEIRALMGRRRMSQAQLARSIGRNEMWISLRLRGRQPIDMNDLNLIAKALDVGVHQLLPPPEVAAQASTVSMGYRKMTDRITAGVIGSLLETVNRPIGRRDSTGPGRTSRIPRTGMSAPGLGGVNG